MECFGAAGSVTLWHHKMMHEASVNRSTGIRSAVIYEFYKKEDPALDNSYEAEMRRGNLPDMWGDWSAEVQAAPLGPRLASRQEGGPPTAPPERARSARM